MGRLRYAYNSFSYYGEEMERSIERVAGLGYDAIELVGEASGSAPRRAARDAGIAVSSISIESIRQGGEYAASPRIDLALEPWNRYETYFLNRLEQAVELWRATELEHGGVMGDTFHMNIEEASIPDAFRAAGGLLGHVHLADSNRAVAGRGHTDFRPILRALGDIDFRGYLSFEVMAPSGDPMGIPAGAGPESFDADTRQAIAHLKAIELEL